MVRDELQFFVRAMPMAEEEAQQQQESTVYDAGTHDLRLPRNAPPAKLGSHYRQANGEVQNA